MGRFLNGHAIICVVLAVAGCGKAPAKPEPSPAPSAELELFYSASDRLLGLADDGMVVSRWEDGRVAHHGDSVLWTSMAMGTLDCMRGSYPEAALLDMLAANGGKICRHPDLCGVKDPLLDSHLGFFWGVTHRVKLCPGSLPVWAEAFDQHVTQNVPEAFDVVRLATRSALGIGSDPDGGSVSRFLDLLAGWATAVNAAKAAGYRVHLGLLSIETLEAAGIEIPPAKRDLFCAASRGMDLGTVDHYCGRSKLREFVDTFQFNTWEYRHQRAWWESADGKDGLSTPALDLIIALRKVFIL